MGSGGMFSFTKKKKKKIRVWEKSVAAEAGPPRLVPKAGALSDGPLEVTDHETRT